MHIISSIAFAVPNPTHLHLMHPTGQYYLLEHGPLLVTSPDGGTRRQHPLGHQLRPPAAGKAHGGAGVNKASH